MSTSREWDQTADREETQGQARNSPIAKQEVWHPLTPRRNMRGLAATALENVVGRSGPGR